MSGKRPIEVLAPHLVVGTPLGEAVSGRVMLGLRVLAFARAVDPDAPLGDLDGRPRLPALEPLAVVALADELRTDVTETTASRAEGPRRAGPSTLAGHRPFARKLPTVIVCQER